MTAPRQIKASEVGKGMRVRWEDHYSDATVTTEGLVSSVTTGPAFAHIDLGSARQVGRSIDKDHPVTVLADPEPEWVEGAWYVLDVGGHRRPGRRVEGGWSSWADGPTHGLSDDDELTVLGRVLIVDWPGDDAARELAQRQPLLDARTVSLKAGIEAVADAIRTQGGAR